MQENKFTQYVLDTQKIREKLVGKRWFYQGNYVFTEEMEASEEYFDNPPIKHIVWEFTED